MVEKKGTKKTYLQQLRNRFQSVISRAVSYCFDDEDCGPVETEDKFLPRGIPKEFHHLKFNSPGWCEEPFLLSALTKIIKLVRNSNMRTSIVDDLKKVSLPNQDPNELIRIQDRLKLNIYEYATGETYSFPKGNASKDVIERNFFNFIGKGIEAYKGASLETRKQFNESVLSDIKRTNTIMAVRQQQKK